MSINSSNEKSLWYLTLIYSVGSIGSKGISFLLLFIMTYFLSAEDLGKYDIILTSATLIVPCISMCIDSAVFRWLITCFGEVNQNRIIKNVLGFLYLAITIYFFIYILISYFTSFENNIKVLFFFYTCLLSIFPIIQQILRGVGKQKEFVINNILYAITFFILSILSLVYGLGINYVLLSNIIALVIVIFRSIYFNNWGHLFFSPLFEKGVISEFIRYCLPLLPNSMSWWAISSSIRYLILVYLGERYNGIFSISYKYPTIILILSEIFALAWQEKFFKTENLQTAIQTYYIVLVKYIKLLFGFALILSGFSKFFIGLLATDFSESLQYIPFLILAVSLQALATFVGVFYLREKRSSLILISSFVGSVSTIITAFLLIKYKLYGVSISVLVGFIIVLCWRIIDLKVKYGIKFPYLVLFKYVFLFSCSIYSIYIENLINYISICLIIIFFVAWDNKEITIKIYAKIMKLFSTKPFIKI